MSAPPAPGSPAKTVAVSTLLYFALALVGIALSRHAENVAVIWFANAIVVAYMSEQPLKTCVPLFAGAMLANFFANLLFGSGPLMSLLFCVANAIEIVLVTYVIKTYDLARDFDKSSNQLLKLIMLGIFWPCGVSATLGAAIASWAGLGSFEKIFPTWYVGAALGLVLMFPLMKLILRPGQQSLFKHIRWGYFIRFALPSVLVAVLTLEYLPFPFVYVLVILTFAIQKLSFEEAHVLITLTITGVALVIAFGQVGTVIIAENWRILLVYLPVLITAIPAMLLSASMNEGKIKEAERMQFAVDLSNSQAALQTVIDHMQAMIGYWDRDGVNHFANGAYQKWFGIDETSMPGKHMRELVGEERYQNNLPHIEAALRGEAQMFERVIIDTTGEQKHALVSYIPHAFNGEVRGFYTFVSDVTPIKQAQLKETRAQARLTSIFEAASEFAIIATDIEGNVQLFSKGAERLLGYRAEDIVNRQPPVIIHLREEVHQRAVALTEELGYPVKGFEVFVAKARMGILEAQPWTYLTSSGEHVPVTVMVSAVRNEKNEIDGFLGVATDISRHKLLEASLITAKEEAELASRTKSEFLANMSHEIRTPMNAVLGMSYLLSKTELNHSQRNYLEMIRSSGQSLLSILNDILDISKIEAGRIELSPTRFYLKDILSALANMMSVNAGEKKLELSLGIDADVPRELVGDALRLQQVLINLIGNAIKFTESGEVSMLVQLKKTSVATPVAATDRAGNLPIQFIVRDTGIGMSPEQIGRLFNAFEQADASTSRRFGGTGLGLAISKRFVDLMGGNISVTSTEGQGTEFCVEVMMQIAAPVSDADIAIALADGTTDIHSLQPKLGINRILVVDDNATSRSYIAKTIEAWGWRADTVGSGAVALDMVRQQMTEGGGYSAILVDWHMPGLDGLATVAALRVILSESAVPLLLMSSPYERSNIRLDKSQPMPDAVLLKPVTGSSLYDVLQETSYNKTSGNTWINRSNLGDSNATLPASHGRAAGTLSGQVFAGNHVLLVDDNKFNQIVASEILQQTGISLEVANNGSEAVEMLKTHADRFDLILMDVQMPIMDGWVATEILRKEHALQMPILAMTAGVMHSERERCHNVGMNDVIAKPIDVDQLLKTLARYLPKKPQPAGMAVNSVNPANSVDAATNQTGVPAMQDASANAITHTSDASPDIGSATGVFDPDKLISLSKGNPAVVKTLFGVMKNMIGTARSEFNKARQFWDAGETVQAARTLHTLRGSIGTLGAKNFAETALELEMAISGQDSQAILPLFALAETRLTQTVSTVQHWLQEQASRSAAEEQVAASHSNDAQASVSQQQLDEFSALLQTQNMKACEVYQTLKPGLATTGAITARWPAARRQALDTAMLALDFHAALELVNDPTPTTIPATDLASTPATAPIQVTDAAAALSASPGS
ncbi:response regulator [Undibacterium sp. TJN19]|uniref:response regulator n=1 Tax=Undibacterium sp. TJN19 TaxID=3413055 RepID=UPI003BF377B3